MPGRPKEEVDDGWNQVGVETIDGWHSDQASVGHACMQRVIWLRWDIEGSPTLRDTHDAHSGTSRQIVDPVELPIVLSHPCQEWEHANNHAHEPIARASALLFGFGQRFLLEGLFSPIVTVFGVEVVLQ